MPGGSTQLTGHPGVRIPLPSSCCLYPIRLQNASPLLSCWRFTTQSSSPSSLEGLRTHFPGANTQEGVGWLPVTARTNYQRGQAGR